MTDTATYQADLLLAQQSLQQANTDVFNANASPNNNATLQNDVNTNKAQTQATFDTDAANLISSEATDSLTNTPIPTLSGLAPLSSTPPMTVDPASSVVLTNYASPSIGQITNEAISKIALTGTASLLSSITPGLKVITANGSALAINSSNGITYANMGVVNVGNTLPANTITTSASDKTQSFKVTLSQQPVLSGDPAGNSITFEIMPAVSESGSAEYTPFSPIQHPGDILKYKGSASRDWGINVKLVSRNVQEATDNLRKINLIRSWRMPFYGTGTAADAATARYLGAPPPVLSLKGYGPQMIGPVTCVLTNYSWTHPNDVDYIPTSTGTPFPVLLDIQLSLKESYSPAEYTRFDLLAYRNGNLSTAYGGAVAMQTSTSGTAYNQAPSSVDTSSAQMASSSKILSANSSANSLYNSSPTGFSAYASPEQIAGGTSLSSTVLGTTGI
jgi:hypothetical protein